MGNRAGKSTPDVSRLDYRKLAALLADQMCQRGLFVSDAASASETETVTGVARIISDDCEYMIFFIPGLAQNQRIRFEKDGHESWVETVKYSHRNEKRISVTYETEPSGVGTDDGEVVVYQEPTDIHDE